MRKQKGFSLIELLIVVAIILVIAAIAIPNLLRSKIAANEASAVGSLRSINTAETTFASTYPDFGYQNFLAYLGGDSSQPASSSNALLLDNVLACPTAVSGYHPCPKSGYNFWVDVPGGSQPYSFYTAYADPLVVDQTGKRNFYTDTTAVIRFDPGCSGPHCASVADAPLQ